MSRLPSFELLQHDKPTAESEYWLRFVEFSGERGRQWLNEYHQPECLRLEELSQKALNALRSDNKERGLELLGELEDGLSRLGPVPDSVRQVLIRWYHGVLAYYEYSVGHYDLADQHLTAANQAVCQAIEAEDFLLLLATHCQEFILHRARTARGRRRWKDLRFHVDIARKMLNGEIPLCELSSGNKIFFADIERVCISLWAKNGFIFDPTLFDSERRQNGFNSFVQSIYVIPGFVLHYR